MKLSEIMRMNYSTGQPAGITFPCELPADKLPDFGSECRYTFQKGRSTANKNIKWFCNLFPYSRDKCVSHSFG